MARVTWWWSKGATFMPSTDVPWIKGDIWSTPLPIMVMPIYCSLNNWTSEGTMESQAFRGQTEHWETHPIIDEHAARQQNHAGQGGGGGGGG